MGTCNKQEVMNGLKSEWESIATTVLTNLIESMAKQCATESCLSFEQ